MTMMDIHTIEHTVLVDKDKLDENTATETGDPIADPALNVLSYHHEQRSNSPLVLSCYQLLFAFINSAVIQNGSPVFNPGIARKQLAPAECVRAWWSFTCSWSPALCYGLLTYGDSSDQELVNWVDVCCYSRTFDRTCLHEEAGLGGSMD